MGEAAESLGAFVGLFARMVDDILDREFEGHYGGKVPEHLKMAYGLHMKGIQVANG